MGDVFHWVKLECKGYSDKPSKKHVKHHYTADITGY